MGEWARQARFACLGWMARARDPDLPDWRDEAAYLPLMKAERAGFAWEWLRRHPRFRTVALGAIKRGIAETEDRAALEWGLHRFEDPRQSFSIARPVWTSLAHPWVVSASAKFADVGDDVLNAAQLSHFSKLVSSAEAERLLLSDGYRTIRLDLVGAPLGNSVVALHYNLSGIRRLDRPLTVLTRLRSLVLTGRFVGSHHPPVRRACRLVQLLRTLDALHSGANQADIAEFILSPMLDRVHWRIHSPSLRSRVQRLTRQAKRTANNGFWSLLS
jgi:hypothetical protein